MKKRGFTLTEVAVSIFVIGVMLTLLAAVIRSSTLVRISNSHGVALAIARSELESLRSGGYEALPGSGPFSDSLLSDLPPFATAALEVSEYDEETKRVSANVVWRDPGSPASTTVSLSTLITKVGGLP